MFNTYDVKQGLFFVLGLFLGFFSRKYRRLTWSDPEPKFKQLKGARGKGLQAGIEVTDTENPWKGDEQLAAKICNEMFKKGFS